MAMISHKHFLLIISMTAFEWYFNFQAHMIISKLSMLRKLCVGNTMTIAHTEIRKYTPPGILHYACSKTALISTKKHFLNRIGLMKIKWVNLKQKKFHNMCFYTQEWNLKVIHFSFADCSSTEYKIYGTAKKKRAIRVDFTT